MYLTPDEILGEVFFGLPIRIPHRMIVSKVKELSWDSPGVTPGDTPLTPFTPQILGCWMTLEVSPR